MCIFWERSKEINYRWIRNGKLNPIHSFGAGGNIRKILAEYDTKRNICHLVWVSEPPRKDKQCKIYYKKIEFHDNDQ